VLNLSLLGNVSLDVYEIGHFVYRWDVTCCQTTDTLHRQSESEFYVHVTAHRNTFLFNKTNRRTNFPNLFCQETLHVSGSSSAHHQACSTVHSALVYVYVIKPA
jgi:hypothetical protein